ncbi:hypothetical protein HNR19_003348 [Nocardioides thalensis]|uniref:Uncharacterized protein n=1 Tax=Nocardioides thalensis TaxID=1914755 RepID=A0A853C3B3_9ACTN|nr:hypothetical protein [Nocardioides thalensis]NYJ02650.1 hypothetical protein [Nocardioides thalensis]
MRSRAWATAAASTVLLVGALGGCSSDDPEGGTADPSSPSATDDPSASEPSSTEETSTGPEAATGPRVETQTVVYHLPEDIDWDLDGGGTFASWSPESSAALWSVHQFEHQDSSPPTLDELARISLRNERGDYPSIERTANREVGGIEGIVLEYDDRNDWGRREFHYEFETVHAGWWVSLGFSFPRDNAQTRQVIDSVLASVEWKLEE